MPTLRRRHFSRIVLWQECVGNVLDLPARWCLAASGPEETRAQTAAGTERATRRTHTIQVPLSEGETARLADVMAELSDLYGHKVGATLLGSSSAQHITWAQPTSLQVTPEGGELFGMAASVLRLQTSIFHAAIAESKNLLAPVPWEGTSTPGSPTGADGFTTLVDGDIAVYDDSLSEIFLYERWDGDTYRRLSVPALGSPAGLTSYVRSGAEELILVDAANDQLVRIDVQGNTLGTITPQDSGGSGYQVAGVTVASDDLVLLSESDDLHIYSGVPASGTASATSTTSVSTDTGLVLGYDELSGDLLSIQDVSGTLQARRHDGVAASVGDTTGVTGDGVDAYDGTLYILEDPGGLQNRGLLGTSGLPLSTEGEVDLTRRMPLRVRNANGRPERGYYGPTWTAGHEVSVGIGGVPDMVSSTKPVILDLTLPIGTAEVRLENVTGELDGLDFGGTSLGLSDSSRIGSPPQLLLEGGKYSGLGINLNGVWAVRSRLEDVANRPELVVVSAGDARGALEGAYSKSCVISPGWAGAVEAIAFDWEADAGDELSIQVNDAAGNYIGQISGEGEEVTGTSATFTAENAGTYTAELVAESFEGITEGEVTSGRVIFDNGNGTSRALVWNPDTDQLDLAPELAFTVSPSQEGQELDLGFLDDTGADVDVIEYVVITKDGDEVDVLDYPGDLPYTFAGTGTYGVTVVGVPDLDNITTFGFGYPGGSEAPTPSYNWDAPTDLTDLDDLTAIANQSYDTRWDFSALDVTDPDKITRVGNNTAANNPKRNAGNFRDVKTDIFDKFPNLKVFAFLRWGSFTLDSTVSQSTLLDTDVREVYLGPKGRDLFGAKDTLAIPTSAVKARFFRYANPGGIVGDTHLRGMVRLQSYSDRGGTREAFTRAAWIARIHLARFPTALPWPNVGDNLVPDDAREGTGDFAAAYDSHDPSSETITFQGDLRNASYTIDGVTFGDDAFPDPQDPNATDPDGKALWPNDADADYIVRGTAQYPGERIFMVDEDLSDSSAQLWMLSTTQAGTVTGSGNTQVSLGSEGSKAKIWKAGEGRTTVTPGTYDLDSIDWTLNPHLRDGLSGAGLIV